MLLHPLALVVLALVILCATILGAKSGDLERRLTWRRLLVGLIAVLVAALLLAAIGSYVSPEQAQRFGVGPEDYASALWRQFAVLAIATAYLALFGCAIIGVPITVFLARHGLATVPIVVGASILLSAATLFVLGLLSSSNVPHFLRDLVILVGSHAFLTLGFSLGVGLPWHVRPKDGNGA